LHSRRPVDLGGALAQNEPMIQNIWGAQTDFGLTSDEMLDEMGLHFARHLGDYQTAFSDADGWKGVSKEHGPPVDVLVVPPKGERRFAYVASFGCAFRPLPARSYAEQGVTKRVEFVLAAPQRGDLKTDREMMNIAANTVRQFAKLVHLQPITVEPGETVAFSDDPQPMFAGSQMAAFAFTAPRLPADGFETMKLASGEIVRFVAPTPIYRDELDAARDHGPAALVAALTAGHVTEMLDLNRPSVAHAAPPPRRGWLSRLLGLVGIR
jgi:hypothetical protein